MQTAFIFSNLTLFSFFFFVTLIYFSFSHISFHPWDLLEGKAISLFKFNELTLCLCRVLGRFIFPFQVIQVFLLHTGNEERNRERRIPFWVCFIKVKRPRGMLAGRWYPLYVCLVCLSLSNSTSTTHCGFPLYTTHAWPTFLSVLQLPSLFLKLCW